MELISTQEITKVKLHWHSLMNTIMKKLLNFCANTVELSKNEEGNKSAWLSLL